MNNKKSRKTAGLLAAWIASVPAFAAEAPTAAMQPDASQASRRCTSVKIEPPSYVTLGKSSVIPLSYRVVRILGSGQAPARAPPASMVPVAQNVPAALPRPPAAMALASDGIGDVDIMLLSPNDLFIRGKNPGSMNVVLQNADGGCFIRDIVVTIDPGALQAKLTELMPEENRIKVSGADRSLVLTGEVSDAIKLDEVLSLATSYGDGKKVVNMLRITSPQQVMLEVKIAEVSKTLLDKLGAQLGIFRSSGNGSNNFSLRSNLLTNGGALFEAVRLGRTSLTIDGQKDDGLVRVLAEPNIMAISGQSASFLSGGKIFIPVSQTNNGGVPTITLEEKEFGIGVKFTPTVLGGSRINLKMVSEVSDLSQVGSPFTTVGGVTSVLPSLTVRRADTTVQLNDGQSFVIAGLIKNNITETVKRIPGLGEIPIVGALARSTEFQTDQTELLFVVTPRLVKALAESPRLPTDNHAVPSRAEIYLRGALESSTPPTDEKPAGLK